jgi:hypothetical protein
VRVERAANTDFVERLYPKTKVIKIAAFNARRGAAGTSQLAVDWHKVDQGSTGPKLDQTDRILSALDRARNTRWSISRMRIIGRRVGLDARHDPQIANGTPVQCREGRLITRAIVYSDGMLD